MARCAARSATEASAVTPDLMRAGAIARHAAERAPIARARAAARGGREPSDSRVVAPGELDIAHGAILYLDDITRQLRRLQGAQRLSLVVDAGELRCIIGPNGAGKTTMMDVITGKTRPDAARCSSARRST